MKNQKRYEVKEVFRSIQGEGTGAGYSAVFVRFAGCNLRCEWCDTAHEGGDMMTEDDIVKAIREAGRQTNECIVLTGGEPLLQLDTALLTRLLWAFEQVCIETNGTLPMPEPDRNECNDEELWVTWSPKDPETYKETKLAQVDEVKVVVPGNGWDKKKLLELAVWVDDKFPFCRLAMQPEDVSKDPEQHHPSRVGMRLMTDVCLADPVWRASLQLHKHLGVR